MITIYCSKLNFTGLRNTSLKPVTRIANQTLRSVPASSEAMVKYTRCPVFRDHLTNLFSYNAPFDYNLKLKSGRIESDFYDQQLFQEYVFIRSMEEKLFSLMDPCLVIPDCDSLEMSQTPAYLDQNGFVDNTIVIPGSFDIAKWPRKVECPFYLKNDSFDIKEGDALLYIKFHTKEKIKIKNFIMTDKMHKFVELFDLSKQRKTGVNPINFFYDLLNSKNGLKKKMLEEAKANVID